MDKTLITIVIPARMASSRYPGKPLALISGIPLIEHVRRRALLAKEATLVVVATCDLAIKNEVEQSGGTAVMTKNTHERCTDRIEEAIQNLPGDIIVMVQGDEPLLIPDAITSLVEPLLLDKSLPIVNLLSPLESEADYLNPNIVKAACNKFGNIMYFSRSSIPLFREKVEVPIFRQTGIMAFRRDSLINFGSLAPTPFEKAESIDMFRALENDIKIKGVVVNYPTIGVDRPEDVYIVENLLNKDEIQKQIFKKITKIN
jgi:3-deoxy-manno-octulosonate cytidylyltransferase (CMP-KDO synthetase)